MQRLGLGAMTGLALKLGKRDSRVVQAIVVRDAKQILFMKIETGDSVCSNPVTKWLRWRSYC